MRVFVTRCYGVYWFRTRQALIHPRHKVLESRPIRNGSKVSCRDRRVRGASRLRLEDLESLKSGARPIKKL